MDGNGGKSYVYMIHEQVHEQLRREAVVDTRHETDKIERKRLS